jgi:hypothetical protein
MMASVAWPDCTLGNRRTRVNAGWLRRRWLEAKGTVVPKGMVLMHRCDEPRCDNLDHLLIGTQGDNLRDASMKGRLRGFAPLRGEENPTAKLTEQEVFAIRDRRRNGEGIRAIARDMRMAHSSISNIVSGRRWAHAGG